MVVGVAASTQTQVTELQNDKKFHEQIGRKKVPPSKSGGRKKLQRANLQKKLYRAKREKRYNEQIGMKKGTTSKSGWKKVQQANRDEKGTTSKSGLKKRYNEQIDKKVTPRKLGEQSYDQIDKKSPTYVANQDINFHRN